MLEPSKYGLIKELMDKRLISLVIPLYNEVENVEQLYLEIVKVIDSNNINAEFVFVDDGSKDKTVARLIEVAGFDTRTRIVEFRRNFGQTAAMAAGFDYAEGDICLLYTSPSPRDRQKSRMPSSA